MKFYKKIIFLFLILITFRGYSQNTLDNLGLTSSTPASVAYSLRKLSSSYVGFAVQVRRSNDNATQDIGFTSGGDLDTSALLAFVGVNNGYVGIWYDQSGNGRNLTQTNVSRQPSIVNYGVVYTRNSVPTIFHDNIDDGMLYSGSNYLTTNPLSVNIVASSNSNNAGARRAVQGTNNWLIGPYSNKHSWYAGGWNHQINDAWSLTSLEIFTVIQPISNSNTSFRNSESLTTLNNKGVPNKIQTGAEGAYSEPLDGFLSEILVFNSEINTVNRTAFENTQRLYYNICVQPAEPMANDQSFNSPATVADLVATGTNIKWYLASTGGSSLPTSTNLASGTYYVTQTVNSCESARKPISVTIISCSAPTLSNFNNSTKTYFDVNYTITPPSSNSAGLFTYTSSNLSVATVSGTTVTIVGLGSTTITATQDADGSYCSGSVTSTLTVNGISVVTKYGQFSTTNFNYVNKNGALGGDFGINKNGNIIQTKSYDLSTDLVMHLDAGNATSYPGSGTTWTDLSGLGNNGTLVNNPVYNSSNGGNLVFNGSNTYVNAPLTKTASCTFSVWAKSTNTNSGNMLFNAGNDGAGPDLFFSGGVLSWNTWDSSANPFGNIPATSANGNWHNYVVVNDAVSNTAKLYYDGVLYGTAVYKNASSNTTLYIGGNTSSYMWNGAIGNFQVHNRLLTPAEVVQNFNNLKTRYGL